MANFLYTKARESFLKGEIAFASATIRVMLLDAASYTPNQATDQFFSDIPVGARVGSSGGTTRASGIALASKTTTGGIADAADVTIPTVPAGSPLEYILIYVDDGSADATSRLIALIDTATGLPVTPGGGDVQIVFDNGANKIFSL